MIERNNQADTSSSDNSDAHNVAAAVVDTTSCCASCGIPEIDDIKLTECADCDLVRYCSDECQENHTTQHQEDCKKRGAELRDELLFKQPESNHLGDCPICMIPLSLDTKKSTMHNCCSKVVCNGCAYANAMREKEGRLRHTCPFCRKPAPKTMDEVAKQRMKRIEANDPVAMRQEGRDLGKKGDYQSAFGWYTRAAELGDTEAHCQLAAMYHNGEGVEKDKGMEIYHWEEAAIGGHPKARYNIGCNEWNKGNTKGAVRHLIIAANLGGDDSIRALMHTFRRGFVDKDELAAALRAHQDAVDSTKSLQREAAVEYEI